MIQIPGGDIWLSYGCQNRHSGQECICNARQQAIPFGFGSAELVDNDQVHVGIDRVRNAMSERRETAWIELAAARFTTPILCDAFCLARSDIYNIELSEVFGHITKYIKMGASSNFGNMFSVSGPSIFLPFLPMAPIQVLTNNLLYDFSQTTIPTDNVDEEYLASPRKWDIGNIFKFMVFIGPISSIFDYATYGMMLYVFDAWNNPSLFQTGWFVESLLTQTLIIHII